MLKFLNARLQRSILITIVIAPAFLAGCATMTEAQIEARTYRNAMYEAEFLDYRAVCENAGRRVFIDARNTVGRDGIPTYGDRYYCM